MGHKLRVVGKFLLALSISSGVTVLMVLSDNEILQGFGVFFAILTGVIFSIGFWSALFSLFDWILE